MCVCVCVRVFDVGGGGGGGGKVSVWGVTVVFAMKAANRTQWTQASHSSATSSLAAHAFLQVRKGHAYTCVRDRLCAQDDGKKCLLMSEQPVFPYRHGSGCLYAHLISCLYHKLARGTETHPLMIT